MVRALARIGPLGLIVMLLLAGDSLHSTEGVRACGNFGPYDFDTWESENYIQTYNRAIDLAVAGKAVTAPLTVGDEVVDLRYTGLSSGPRGKRVPPTTANRIPPTIFKSIAYVEANWSMAANSVVWGGVGPALRSADCGYGIAQATSSMGNDTGTVTARQALIGTDFVYNLAEGVRILADKWNSGGPIAGNGDPNALEDWYFAIWRYNGFAFVNHPLNPEYDPLRGGVPPEPPATGPGGPSGSPQSGLPSPSPTLPRSPSPAASTSPSPSPSPSATPSPTLTPTPTLQPGTPIISPAWHCSDPSAVSYQATASGSPKFNRSDYPYQEKVYGCMRNPPKLDAGKPMWPAQVFNMPDFTNDAVARAFAPQNYLDCVNPCASMDFPTSYPSLTGPPVGTHPDTTPPANPVDAAGFFGTPKVQVVGPASVSLLVYADGSASNSPFVVKNAGTFIAPFRIRASVPWIVVRHPDDNNARTLDAGVAIGADVQVVSQKADGLRPRVASAGFDSNLVVSVDASQLPSGSQTGVLYIDPLLGGGAPIAMIVTVTRSDLPGALPFKLRTPQLATAP